MIGTDKIFKGQRLDDQTFVEVIKALKQQMPYSSLKKLYLSFEDISDEQGQQIAEALQVECTFEELDLVLKNLCPSRQADVMIAIVASDSLKSVSVDFGDHSYLNKEAISQGLAAKISGKLDEALEPFPDPDVSREDAEESRLWDQVTGHITSLYNVSKGLVESYTPSMSEVRAVCTACLPSSPKPKME
ncbi:MAG: hypothetical protein U1E78_02455 [Gammaproteobacteria bacterium]